MNDYCPLTYQQFCTLKHIYKDEGRYIDPQFIQPPKLIPCTRYTYSNYTDLQLHNLISFLFTNKLIHYNMNNLKQFLKRTWQKKQVVVEYWKKSPTTKIILINTAVYAMWKLKPIPEEFMVKHFSSERYNIQSGRIHTLLTYSFSHMGIFSLGFDLIMLGLIGRSIQSAYGNKYIYLLYGLGTLFGGITHVIFQRPSPYIQPLVGAESALGAYLAFICLLNPHQTFMVFFFPMRAWVLMLLAGTYSLLVDPHKKLFAGMTAGMTVYQLMRGRFI